MPDDEPTNNEPTNNELTQAQVDTLIAKLQYCKYQVSFGSTILGPLNSPPKVEPDTETKDTVLYETGSEPQAQVLSKNNAKITLEVCDVATSLGLVQTIKKGDNLLDSTKGQALTFVPYGSGAAITFPHAFIQPGLQTNFAEGDDPNYITLTFIAKPDATTKELFTVS